MWDDLSLDLIRRQSQGRRRVRPVADLPAYLKPLANAMPLCYGNTAMRDVMIKGWGLAEIWPTLAVLLGFAALCIVLSAAMMRREVA